MRIFLRIIVSILLVCVFSSNAMNKKGRKKSQGVQEHTVDGADKSEEEAKSCLMKLKKSRYDRSIYTVDAVIEEEMTLEDLKNFTQIIWDYFDFNKKKKEDERLKTISAYCLARTIRFFTSKNPSLKNFRHVDDFFKAIKALLPYYEPNLSFFYKKIGMRKLRKVGTGNASVSSVNVYKIKLSEVRFELGSNEDKIDIEHEKSKTDYEKLKALVAQASKKWKELKK